jgi:hypothetical protein
VARLGARVAGPWAARAAGGRRGWLAPIPGGASGAGWGVDAKKMAKHFELDIADGFACRGPPDSMTAEAAHDGLYIVRN